MLDSKSIKRIGWIDSLKGYGIFCVTLGHLSCDFLLETHIYSFHMFLFFFLSGFLHNIRNYDTKTFVCKKTRTIFVPFLIWNFASFLAGLMLNISFEESIRTFFLLDGEVCWNAPIWFLLLLYMTEIIYFILNKIKPHRNLIVIIVLLFTWIKISNQNVILKLNILPPCLLFYMFGDIFREYSSLYSEYNKKINKWVSIFLFSSLLGLNVIFGIVLNNRISFTGADFGNVLYCCVAAIAGVFFYIIIFQKFKCLSNNKVLDFLGKNSMIIMASQYWFFKFSDILSYKFFDFSIWHYRNTLKAVFMTLITITIIMFVVSLLKKISKENQVIAKICSLVGISGL